MDNILDRLWELSDYIDRQQILPEAQHLWKTIETLVTSYQRHELRVQEDTFAKLLASMPCVLSAPLEWKPLNGTATNTRSVFVLVCRVLVKLGCRGEEERDAVIKEGIVDLLVDVLTRPSMVTTLSGDEVASSLQVFQTLAFDTKHRQAVLKSSTVNSALSAMRTYPRDAAVQFYGCKFLQFMAYDELAKEQIVQQQGIRAVLDALVRFAGDVQLAISASDVLYFLSLDLDTSSTFALDDAAYITTARDILDSIVKLMQRHRDVHQIQVHGIAVINSFIIAHSTVRREFCELHIKVLWDVLNGSLGANDDAASDTIDVLESIFSDGVCVELLSSALVANSTSQEAHQQLQMLHQLTTFKRSVDHKQSQNPTGTKPKTMFMVMNGLQVLLNRSRDVSSNSPTALSPQKAIGVEDIKFPVTTPSPSLLSSLLSSRAENVHKQEKECNEIIDDNRSEDSIAMLDDDHGPTSPLISPTVYSIRSPNYQENVITSEEIKSINPNPPLPPPCSSKVVQALRSSRKEYRLLQESYQILLKRAHEQSNLLNLQNARIKNHMETHQLVLDRVQQLQIALEDATRKHQVERELRLAEVAQSDQISQLLHEAMKEIKTLNAQKSSTTRELQHNEKLRVDYQLKASEIKQRTRTLEHERDDAVLQMRALQSERKEWDEHLERVRREAQEALLMREEDVDAPKCSLFSTLLRQAATNASLGSPSRRGSIHRLTTKHVINTTHPPSQQDKRHSTTKVHRKSSVTGWNGGENVGPLDLSDDEEMLPRDGPREHLMNGSSLIPPTPRVQDLEHQLRITFESLQEMETGGTPGSVHLAIVRRYFQDCGVVQSPLVLGDVDTILTKVLNQAQESRKRVMIRKDYSVHVDGAIGSTSFTSKEEQAKRFRYFDHDAFYEAVTLLAMRRYPRVDVHKAIEMMITEYMHPIQTKARHDSMVQTLNTTSRRASMSSIGGGGAASPTAMGISVLKAMLSGLVLHINNEPEPSQPQYHIFRNGRESGTLLVSGESDGETRRPSSGKGWKKPKREEILYSLLEMHSILAREYKPLATICEFYSAFFHSPRDAATMIKATSTSVDSDGTFLPLSFELLLSFAMDFEIIPAFMDRVSLKHLYSEVSGYIKTYFALHKTHQLVAVSTDPETLKKIAFSMLLGRLAIELFSTKREYETPEKQITALLQWIDNSIGREKIMKKATLPIVIKFSRRLYAPRASIHA